MDARLHFANARKLKEFVLRAIAVRERSTGEEVAFAVIDAKSINDVDMSGVEALDALASTLHNRGQKLVLANLKGPVSARLHAAHFPEHLKAHGGVMDTTDAEAIVNGSDPSGEEAWQKHEALAKRVRTNTKLLQSKTNSTLCSATTAVRAVQGGTLEFSRTLSSQIGGASPAPSGARSPKGASSPAPPGHRSPQANGAHPDSPTSSRANSPPHLSKRPGKEASMNSISVTINMKPGVSGEELELPRQKPKVYV